MHKNFLISFLAFCAQIICLGELVSRSVKHLFKTYMQGVELTSLSAAISHFLNCYLGSFPAPHANINTEVVRIFCYDNYGHMHKGESSECHKNKTVDFSVALKLGCLPFCHLFMNM